MLGASHRAELLTARMKYRIKLPNGHCFKSAREVKNPQLALLTITVCWLVLCLPGVIYGLPQLLNPDEIIFVDGAFNILAPPYLDPKWYGGPASTLMDLLALLYAIYIFFGIVFGSIDSSGISLSQDADHYILIGRIATAIFFLISALIFFQYVRIFLSRAPAMIASLAYLLSPEMVKFAQIVRMDVFLVFFLILVFYFSSKILRNGDWRNHAWAGASLGAAVASKYPGVVGAVSIVLASVMSGRERHLDFPKTLRFLIVSGVLSVLVAFLFGPYLFINFQGMLADVKIQARDTHLSASSHGFLPNLIFYVTSAVPQVTGLTAAVIGMAGLLGYAFRRPGGDVRLVLAFGICFLRFISSLLLHWDRWALPLAPVIAVGVGASAHFFLEVAARVKFLGPRMAAAIVLVLAVGPSAGLSAKSTFLKATNKDTRVVAAEWMRENIAPGATVALETYAPQLNITDYRVRIPIDGRLSPLEAIWEDRRTPPPYFGSFGSNLAPGDIDNVFSSDTEYVIISDFESRYRTEIDDYPAEYAVYQDIRRRYEVVKSFTPSPWLLGPDITIFRHR